MRIHEFRNEKIQLLLVMLPMLTALSPIDGRYQKETKELAPYFSEYGLIRYKIIVEIEYLLALSRQLKLGKTFSSQQTKALKDIYVNFSLEDTRLVKEIEKTTNHDTKA